MKFASVYYPHGARADDPSSVARSAVKHAQTALAAGFDAVWMGHHYLTEYQTMQPIPVLARLSGEVPGLVLGASFILPLFHPLDFAEQTATLDALCGGTLICNVVLGYRDIEFEAFGVPRSDRVIRFSESVRLVKRLWTESSVSFSGRAFRLRDATISMRPVQPFGPPLWMGANSDAAIRRAARLGDAWAMGPYATLGVLKRQQALYETELTEAAKSLAAVPRVLFRDVVVAEDDRTARAEGQRYLSPFYQQYARWGKEDAMKSPGELTQSFDTLVQDRFIVGTPERALEEVRRYITELNLDWMLVQINRPNMPLETVLRGVRLFGQHVIAALRTSPRGEPDAPGAASPGPLLP